MNELHVEICKQVASYWLLHGQFDVLHYEKVLESATPHERAEGLRQLAKELRHLADLAESAVGELAAVPAGAGETHA